MRKPDADENARSKRALPTSNADDTPSKRRRVDTESVEERKQVSLAKKKTFFDTLSADEQELMKNLQSERSMHLRLLVNRVSDNSGSVECKFCSDKKGNPTVYTAFRKLYLIGGKKVKKGAYDAAVAKKNKNAKIDFGFDSQKVMGHLISSCNEIGLLKAIEVLTVAGGGARDNSVYLASNKKVKSNDDNNEELELAKAQAEEALEDIKKILPTNYPDFFKCYCGETLRCCTATLKCHFTVYCPFFKTWRQILMHLPPVDNVTTQDILEMIPPYDGWTKGKEKWRQLILDLDPINGELLDGLSELFKGRMTKIKTAEAVYYVHVWKHDVKPLTYPDLFVKVNINYHGSTIDFDHRKTNHATFKTIQLEKEEMIPLLIGDKDSIKFVEALALITFTVEAETKNFCLQLLPMFKQSTDVVNAGFRTLLHVSRHLYDQKVALLPEGQLSLNRRQFKDEMRRKLDERDD